MATRTIRAAQRNQAVERVTAAATALAAAFDVAPPAIPTHHREPDYLTTLQLGTIADFLDGLAAAHAAPAPEPKPAKKGAKP